MSPPVRVVLVEDHAMVREALRLAFERRGLVVVGDCGDVGTARRLLAREGAEVDVVVTDLLLPDGKGTDLCANGRSGDGVPAVLVLSGSDERAAAQEAIEAGCAGFLSKALSVDRLVEAVVAVADGAATFPAEVLGSVVSGSSRAPVGHDLSQREREVLALLAQALTIADIAAALHLSVHTVRNHVKQVLQKLHARTQLEAVVIAARAGIVEIGLGDDSRSVHDGSRS